MRHSRWGGCIWRVLIWHRAKCEEKYVINFHLILNESYVVMSCTRDGGRPDRDTKVSGGSGGTGKVKYLPSDGKRMASQEENWSI
jgi:hypothetical protein